MSTHHLPVIPHLDHLKRQAKDLRDAYAAGDAAARERVRVHRGRNQSPPDPLKLSDAHLVIAREYGFTSWPRLKSHVVGLDGVQREIADLRLRFHARDAQVRSRVRALANIRERFERFDPEGDELSVVDAGLVLAYERGYPFWSSYDDYLHLHPAVKEVLAAVTTGDLARLRQVLATEPAAATPRYVDGRERVRIPGQSIPLFCVSAAVFHGGNRRGNDEALARALIAAGADVDFQGGDPLCAAASYGAIGTARALLEAGADPDAGGGVALANAMLFGFTELTGLLARHGAALDLRFAAGLGDLPRMRTFFSVDGALTPDAGALADPYADLIQHGIHWIPRTRGIILGQALLFAALHGKLEAMEELLRLGCDPNALVLSTDLDATVLHRLCDHHEPAHADLALIQQRRLPAVRLLLDHGASVTVRDKKIGKTPIDWARHNRLPLLQEVLEAVR
jgi:hypothetical protein